ncbi:MAG: type II/IV secretion system protein [Candidatus Eisenbacteria sp.]|nr:type II/IV secretion system protein [Candidatus Eisenbacteria bacterium]
MEHSLVEVINLEEELLDAGIVTPEEVGGAGDILELISRLLEEERVTEDTLLDLAAQKLGVPYMDVSEYDIESAVLGLISAKTARRYQLIPLFRFDNTLNVAIANPNDVHALDTARRESGCEIEPVLSSAEAIAHLIDGKYGKGDPGQEVFDTLSDEALPAVGSVPGHILPSFEEEDLADAPVVRIVDLLLQRAVAEGASDIHLEPGERSLRVRFRVDGRLRGMASPNWQLFAPVVSRIKILAEMDIAEKRLPQDGRFEYRSENSAADIRVSTYPTSFGESVVLRILDKARSLVSLENLGFEGDNLRRYGKLVKRPYGIFLVSGPTGSGKTTTLYATLAALKSPEKNIMTLEDPVEYQIPGVRQTQTNPKAGLTFATGLRSILRQDPDILMIGEIRDSETLDMAVRSAMTGHLVLSTLHTNDAPSGIMRLVDMGAEPFLVASSTVGVMAQRLMRRICEDCRVQYSSSPEVLEELRNEGWNGEGPFYRGQGCKACRGTGYRGRVGIFELMTITEGVERLVVEKAPASAIARVARGEGMVPLREAALAKAQRGVTTLEEVLEVTASTS